MASISYDPYLEHKITIIVPRRGADISSTKGQIALQGEKSQGFFHGTTEKNHKDFSMEQLNKNVHLQCT